MKRWITAQQIGLLAHMWDAIGVRDNPVAMEIASALARRVHDGTTADGRQIRYVMRGLPPSALTLLKRVADYHREPDDFLHAAWKEMPKCLPWLTEVDAYKNEAQSTRLARATTWASHVLMARTSADRLVRLGRSFFGAKWKFMEQENDVAAALSTPLQTLRDPWKTTQERARAVEEISWILEEGPDWAWMQIENHLYHRQFFWPLLVLEDSADADLSFSLPVAVDVHPPPAEAKSREDHREVRIEGAGDILDVDEWQEPLTKSVRAGKTLWRSKHGNYGGFRYDVMSERTSVVFDFSAARKVLEPYLKARPKASNRLEVAPFRLGGGSAEAYFAQAVLNGLLGQTNIQSSAASGVIGKKWGLNYKLEKPGGIPAKLRHVFTSRRFEQVVLPKEAEGSWNKFAESEDAVEQTASVRCVYDLATMTDVMQVRGWRQYHYVRCPDIMWAIHSQDRPGLIPRKYAAVKSLLGLLEESEDHVQHIDASPKAVASALWYINSEKKHEHDPKYVPPDLSWAFIRVREDDEDVPFWHLVWDVIGAPERDFEAFLSSTSPSEAAKHLKEALNTFEPNFKRPSHRAPDVLAIVGSECLDERYEDTLTPEARPFAPPPILKRLRTLLAGSPDERIARLIGKTRILLIPREEDPANPADLDLEQHRNPDHPLRKLATFRGGFTQHMADLILGGAYEGESLRTEVLDPLVEEGLLHEVGGTYHLPESVRQRIGFWDVEDAPSLKEKAQRHFQAGCAVAPYVTATRLPSIASDAAFTPEYLHEAQHHFRKALDLAKECDLPSDQGLRREVEDAVQQMLLYHALPRWETVRRMLSFGEIPSYAHEEATRLLQSNGENTDAGHPKHYTLAAQVARKYANHVSGPNPEKSESLRGEAAHHFETALQRIPDFPDEEKYPNKVLVLSHYVEFLKGSSPEEAFEVAQQLRRAVEERPAGQDYTYVPGGYASALDFAGDYTEGHEEALPFYRAGMLIGPTWSQPWVKGLGAAALTGKAELLEAVTSEIITSDAQDLRDLVVRSLKYMRRTRDNPSTYRHVRDRLARGIKQIEALDLA